MMNRVHFSDRFFLQWLQYPLHHPLNKFLLGRVTSDLIKLQVRFLLFNQHSRNY